MQKDTVAGLVPSFQARDWYAVAGRGRVAATTLDRDTEDFGHLVDQEVLIDGTLYRCLAVERHPHGGGWRKGEPVGLLVEAPEPVVHEVTQLGENRYRMSFDTGASS